MQEITPPNLPEQTPPPQPASKFEQEVYQQPYQQQPYQQPYGAVPPMVAIDRDNEHLNTLAVMHYVWAGLLGLGLLFLYVHYMLTMQVMNAASSYTPPNTSEGFPLRHGEPAQVIDDMMNTFIYFYLIAGGLILLGIVLNVISARCIKQRKNRVFSIVVAAINCLQIPLGTVLGIFTIVVLNRSSVAQKYREA